MIRDILIASLDLIHKGHEDIHGNLQRLEEPMLMQDESFDDQEFIFLGTLLDFKDVEPIRVDLLHHCLGLTAEVE